MIFGFEIFTFFYDVTVITFIKCLNLTLISLKRRFKSVIFVASSKSSLKAHPLIF